MVIVVATVVALNPLSGLSLELQEVLGFGVWGLGFGV